MHVVNSGAVRRLPAALIMCCEMKSRRQLSIAEQEAAHRLKALWDEAKRPKQLTQERVAFDFGWKQQSAVSQYLNGVIPLNLDALLKFSALLEVPPEQIAPHLARKLQLAKQDSLVFFAKESLGGYGAPADEERLLALYRSCSRPGRNAILESAQSLARLSPATGDAPGREPSLDQLDETRVHESIKEIRRELEAMGIRAPSALDRIEADIRRKMEASLGAEIAPARARRSRIPSGNARENHAQPTRDTTDDQTSS